MFRGLFKGHDDDKEDFFEPVDPVVEQRRKEKFSTPLIYDDFENQQVEKKTETKKKEINKKVIQKKELIDDVVTTAPKSGYQPMQVISPMSGVTGSKIKKSHVKKKVQTKSKKRNMDDQLVPVISPYFGSFDEENEEIMEDAVLQPVEEKNEITIDEIPSVEENLRNIAKIVEEEKNQLKIIEERTGEFKLDFNDNKEESATLIDEIDDDMSLDELMSLYEKKFTD